MYSKILFNLVLIKLIFYTCVHGSSLCLVSNSNLTEKCVLHGNLTEKDDVNTICKEIMSNETITGGAVLLSLRNGEIIREKSFYSICRNGTSGMLVWISWESFNNQNFKLFPEIFEGHSFIGRKYMNIEKNYQYCKVNLKTGQCLAINSNSESSDFNKTEILIEKIPIRYELHDVKYSTSINQTILNPFKNRIDTFYNLENFSKYIEKIYHYKFTVDIILDLTNAFVEKTEINFYQNGTFDESYIIGDVNKFTSNKDLNAIKNLSALSGVEVFVNGNLVQEIQTVNGKLVTIYDDNENNSDNQEILFQTSKITNISKDLTIVYGEIFNASHVLSSHKNDESDSIDEIPIVPLELHATFKTDPPHGVYPGFKSIFTICMIIFFSVVLIAAADVSRKLLANHRAKEQKRLENQYTVIKETT